MKKLVSATMLLLALAACTRVNVVPVPEVVISDVKPGVSDVSFVVSATDADKIAFVVLEAGMPSPDAEGVLSDGTSVASGATANTGSLEHSTGYCIYAAASGKGGVSTVEKYDFTTLEMEEQPDPSVILDSVSVTCTEVRFRIELSECQNAFYIVSEQMPSLDQIKSSGVEITEGGEYTVSDLTDGTRYIVAAVGFYDDAVSEIASIEMTTDKIQEQGPVEFVSQVEAYYYGDTHNTGNGEYFFVLSDGSNTMDFSLFQLPPYNPDQGIDLPERTYVYDTTYGMNTFDPEKTRFRYSDGREVSFSDGSITVTKSGLQYTLEIDLVTSEGQEFKAGYSGRLDFVNKEEQKPGLPQIDSDVEGLVFTHSIAKYYSESDTHDNCVVHLYDVEPKIYYDSDFLNSEGHMVSLDLGTAVSEEMALSEGTYTISSEGGVYSIVAGYEYEFMGSVLAMGSYLEKMDANLDSSYGFLTEGTATVSRNGNIYKIDIELTDKNGFKVSGSFEGEIEMIDKR